jgi:excisionase family DNA binding protein
MSKPFCVLVVDDDADVGYLFQRLLGGPPEVSTARDGYQAIEKAQQGSFDLAFVDVRLPSLDGIETLQRLKQLVPDAVFIMMSGYADVEEVQRAFSLGAHDFVAKPFRDISEIVTIEQVARYLSLHELTVRRLARERELPAFKVGWQWRVKRELLERWIEREASGNLKADAGWISPATATEPGSDWLWYR